MFISFINITCDHDYVGWELSKNIFILTKTCQIGKWEYFTIQQCIWLWVHDPNCTQKWQNYWSCMSCVSKSTKVKKKNVASYLMKHEYTITILASQMVLFLMLHRIYESYKAWKHKWKLDLSELSRESQVSSATTLASTNQQHNKCHVLMLQPASLSLTAE